MSRDDVTLQLSHDEALVLLDFLSREDEKEAIPTAHEAEKRVLWSIEAQLDKVLVEPFQSDYIVAVAEARRRVVSEDET